MGFAFLILKVMSTIKVHDKIFELNIPASRIQESVEALAARMNEDLAGKNPLFLVILNGAFIFAADLIRLFKHDCHVSFVKLSSYSGLLTTSNVRELIGLDEDINGRTVVIVEDIVDTGITLDNIILKIKSMGAEKVLTATLLFKPEAFRKDYSIDYVGMEIPNDFIIGYGLDYDGKARNLADIYTIVK